MGVFKWLRRERITVTSHNVNNVASDASLPEEQFSQSTSQVGTIRTEEYKRDLAEFQARRSTGNKEPTLKTTPIKKKCGRHSLPVSCTDCATDHDTTFNYEKKSAVKYKKNKRARSNTPEKVYEAVPNIQFLFQNQVFMPGNVYPTFSDPQPSKRRQRRHHSRSPDFIVQKIIDYEEDQVDSPPDFEEDQVDSPPDFLKNSSLPFNVMDFLDGAKYNEDKIDGATPSEDLRISNEIETKDDSRDDKLWEVMSELNNLDQWADEQLLTKSPNISKSDDGKSDVSAYGLPIASARNLDINTEKEKTWNNGKWGVIPVQIKKIKGVTIDQIRKKRNMEVNILRKCRHPNIILLMGLYPDINDSVHIICERCVDSLFGLLHVQGRILSAQTSVQYALDISNALVFLRMQGYIHTKLNSMSVMITNHDTAKLADFGPCINIDKVENEKPKINKNYGTYSPESHYVNIEDASEMKTSDSEPLISANSSETHLKSNSVAKEYDTYRNTDMYHWLAPELFEANEDGFVYPCSKSDVYSLCLILWESCNATIPWKNLTYDRLKEQYYIWKTSLPLPQDGTYPGSLLALLQTGLQIKKNERMTLENLQQTLQTVKNNIDDIGYLVIPARLQNKTSNFSSAAWDTTSPTDSDCFSPQNIEHKVVIHNRQNDTSTDSSEKETRSDSMPVYETLKNTYATYSVAKKCTINDENDHMSAKYELLEEKGYSSACSTPIAKIRTRIKDLTPGVLHKSDSTEYCSILSPNRTMHLGLNDDSNKDQNTSERHSKLSRSFTPKSYKPLHIKVPEYNLDSIKPLLKDQNGNERSSYNFDIKNYSLPTTPIARSNKLRRNAWLSGDLNGTDKKFKKSDSFEGNNSFEDCTNKQSPPEVRQKSKSYSPQMCDITENNNNIHHEKSTETSPSNGDAVRDYVTGLRKVDPPQDFTPETNSTHDRWSFKSSLDRNSLKYKVDEDLLPNMNVKPLVAIHERWIYEANRKAIRSMSLPEDNRSQISAVKPASHCVDTLQKSLPQLNIKKPSRTFRNTTPPNNGGSWEKFCQAREAIATGLSLSPRSPKVKKSVEKIILTPEHHEKVDQATDTQSIEDFIRDLIRKEFQHLIHDMTDETNSVVSQKNEDAINKGIANVVESLNNDDFDRTLRKESLKSFSRVKINGNNKPLLQITFNRSGENSLHVLDNCVNVTICDNSSKEKLNQSIEDTLTEDVHVNVLKRCQAFNAIQEARSTEDLYIDDDLSTQMQENFGGKVKLIPLHGSLHEILCEKEDECCLIKVKQENACDTVYFRCDSDGDARDALDGPDERAARPEPADTVLIKRSFSVVERVVRRAPERRNTPTKQTRPKTEKVRPKSEIFVPIQRETRFLSNSSPSLSTDRDEVELNIENVLSYHDSSSDECLVSSVKCQDDDFELLEKKIEEDLAKVSVACGCLAKISEENLSVLTDEALDKE